MHCSAACSFSVRNGGASPRAPAAAGRDLPVGESLSVLVNCALSFDFCGYTYHDVTLIRVGAEPSVLHEVVIVRGCFHSVLIKSIKVLNSAYWCALRHV